MGRIQSSVGLVTGVPIAETVDQLISISARPRDLLTSRTNLLRQQQAAITELTTLVVGLQLSVTQLGNAESFRSLDASSSDPSLGVRITGEPQPATYNLTPLRRATAHQLVSAAALESPDAALAAGTLQLGIGGLVDSGVALAELNQGQGVSPGQIRITDRSGTSETFDLTLAQDIDDVLEILNSATEVQVTADAVGDRIRLTDLSGSTQSNLRVTEVGLGTTAADLGLQGIDAAQDVALGDDLLALSANLKLSSLQGGRGVRFQAGADDLEIRFRDGTSLTLDLDGGESPPTTFGALLERLNTADPTRLAARISDDGDRLELTDLTTDQGQVFQVTSLLGGSTAEDLGLTKPAAAETLTGTRLLGGLKSPLLRQLAGGAGINDLGVLRITDRAGVTADIDLSAAETLEDVIQAINAASPQVVASVNHPRHGIQLRDVSGSTSQALVIESADSKQSAEQLRIATHADVTEVNSGSLDLQTVFESTRLDDYRTGQGVQTGSFVITDSAGQQAAVNLAVLEAETLGDVLDAINGLSIGVQAQVNVTGDGIELIDTANGSGTLRVEESGTGSTASDLRLLGVATTQQRNGEDVQVIDGSNTLRVTLDGSQTLAELVTQINQANLGIQAGTIADGTGGFRLTLSSQQTGRQNRLLSDLADVGIEMRQLTKAQDALLSYGGSPGQAGILLASSTDTFAQVVDGLELTVNGAASQPVTVAVSETSEELLTQFRVFVDQYNRLQTRLDELTFFNEQESTTGLLFGSHETLRIESDLARTLTNRYFASEKIQSLRTLGVDFDDQGRLELDESKLRQAYQEDPNAVVAFLTDEDRGLIPRLNQSIEQLAGEGSSLLLNRQDSLQANIDRNTARIDALNERLDAERERLLLQFFRMEEAIARLQSNQNALSAIASFPPVSINRNSNG